MVVNKGSKGRRVIGARHAYCIEQRAVCASSGVLWVYRSTQPLFLSHTASAHLLKCGGAPAQLFFFSPSGPFARRGAHVRGGTKLHR